MATDEPQTTTGRARGLGRRGLMAGIAALGAAALTKVTRPDRVEAGHDGATGYAATSVMHLGVINDGGNGANDESATSLNARTILVAAISGGANAAFRVINRGSGGAGIQGLGANPGGDGVTGIGGEMNGASGADDGRGVVATGGNATVTGVDGGIGLDADGGTSINQTGGPGVVATGGSSTSGTSGSGVEGRGGSGGTPGEGVVGFGGGSSGAQANGVRGQTNSSINAGVFGRNFGAGIGVRGLSTSGPGIAGETTSAAHPGVLGSGSVLGVGGVATGTGTGVRGETTAGFGLSGVATTGIGLSGSTSTNVGVFGSADVPGAIGSIGLVGRSGSGTGIVGQGATAARFDGPVIVNGSLTTAGGPNSVAVRHPDGEYRPLYSLESPEPWLEDFGTADLRDGRADVALDPDFDALVKDDDYLVFLTELGDCGGLYISLKHSHNFEVRSRAGAAAIGAFHYRVVARRRDEVGRRMERVTLRHGRLGEPLRLPDVPPQSTIRRVPVAPERPDRGER